MNVSPAIARLARTISLVMLFVGIAFASRATTPSAEAQYTFTDIGSGASGGDYSYPTAINNLGRVVGSSIDASGNHQPTLWTRSKAVELRTLGGSSGVAFGINEPGVIAGYTYTTGDTARRATVWFGTHPIKLGTLGGNDSVALAISNAGQVVGFSNVVGSRFEHATLWNGTTAIDLGTLGGSSSGAFGINSSGQVAGWSLTAGDAQYRATLWNGRTPIDLGTLGGSGSWANGINEAGTVVGYGDTANNESRHAAIWRAGVATDLGVPSGGSLSVGLAINNRGTVVGYSFIPGSDPFQRATIWQDGSARDLNSLIDSAAIAAGWVLLEARAISDLGSIVGIAENTLTHQVHGFLLTRQNRRDR